MPEPGTGLDIALRLVYGIQMEELVTNCYAERSKRVMPDGCDAKLASMRCKMLELRKTQKPCASS